VSPDARDSVAGVWSETKLLARTFKGFTVVDFVTGAVISRVGR
jgi:hypothetical protein